MNEFIKKLIGRLEKKRNASDTKFDNVVEMNAYDDGVDDAIEIVNQLAEEYNNESVKGDLISRSSLIDWINKQREEVVKKQVAGSDGIFTREVLVTMIRCIGTFETFIKNQPTACNDGWIPCSERLPKDEELSQRKEVIVQNIHGEIFTAKYTYNCAHTHKDFFGGYCAIPHIIAWQPLPAPYQPKGE